MQRTLAKAEAIGIRHMLTFTNRWLPHYLALKRLLDDGYIGQPFHAYFHWPTGWGGIMKINITGTMIPNGRMER